MKTIGKKTKEITKQEEIREWLVKDLFGSDMPERQCFGVDTRKKVWVEEKERFYP